MILRQSALEEIIKTLDALYEGEVLIKHDLQTIGKQIALVRSLISKDKRLVDSDVDKAVEVLGEFKTLAKSTLIVGNPPRKLKSRRVDKDLLSQLPPDDE